MHIISVAILAQITHQSLAAVDANIAETNSDSWLWVCRMFDDWYIQLECWWFSSTFTYQTLLRCDTRIVQPLSTPGSSPVSLPSYSGSADWMFSYKIYSETWWPIKTVHIDILWLCYFIYSPAASSIITDSSGSVVASIQEIEVSLTHGLMTVNTCL